MKYDGSKAEDKVCAACIFVESNFSRRINLPQYQHLHCWTGCYKISSYQYLWKQYKQHIFSDSMSALQSISHQHISYPLILDILLLHNDLHNRNFVIIFLILIPSHVGGVGNTNVDFLARTPSLYPITNIIIPATDFLSMSAQSFTINCNLVGIYTLIINCTRYRAIQTSLHFLRYLIGLHFLEENKLF